MADIPSKHEAYDEYRQYLLHLGADNTDSRRRLLRNLRRAVREELTEKEWQAMELYYVRQIKMADIARRLGVNVSTVSRNIKRGREKLKKCLRYGAKELLNADMES
ncbi:MAG: sigma-70 family RNA polymerase sigma factor [Ruminococcaceae bacterium]|nr:sigma-70 family RNA polymerase sigma factor [Oscillospiraceae bacterium]